MAGEAERLDLIALVWSDKSNGDFGQACECDVNLRCCVSVNVIYIKGVVCL